MNKGPEASPVAVPGAGKSFLSKCGGNPWFWVFCLALIVTAVFSPFFFSNGMLFSSDQLSSFDSRVFLRNALSQAHQIPWWFSPRLSGMPTVDALFGDIFYPISMVINAVLSVPRAISFKMIFHIFLAGVFFFLLLRRGFRFPLPLAFTGAVFYMLNTEFFSHLYPGHDGKMFVITWLPFMVWQTKALADSTKAVHAVWLGIGIGMAILTSQIQMTYFTLWGIAAYGAFAAIRFMIAKEPVKALRLGGLLVLACAIGIGIGFIQLYPSYMYVHDAFSVRGVDRGFAYASSWSLHWPEFLSLWVPEFGNTLDYYWGPNAFKLNAEYAGGIALFLAVLSLFGRRRPWRWFWAAVAAFAVLYALGANTPFFGIVYAIIPGVKKFRAPSLLMCWFSFSVVLLAMLFLKDLWHGKLGGLDEGAKKKWTRGLLGAAAALFFVAVLFSLKDLVSSLLPFVSSLDTDKRRIFEANYDRNFIPMLWLWLLFILAAAGSILGVIWGKLRPGAALAVLFAIGCIDLLRVDAQFIKIIDPRPYFADEPVLRELRQEMAEAPFRCFTFPGALPRNAEGIHGLEGVGGFHDNELRWYRDFRGDQSDRNFFANLIGMNAGGQPYLIPENLKNGNAFLNIANVKYYLARQGDELLSVRNEKALGRLSFAPRWTLLDDEAVFAALQGNGYDYATTVALAQEPTEKPAVDSGAAAAPMPVRWLSYTPNRRTAEVEVPADGFLRISEVYYPGWKVKIDGKETAVYRADGAFMAVALRRGAHTVELLPHSLYIGLAWKVTLATIILLCIVCAAAVVLCRVRKKGQ